MPLALTQLGGLLPADVPLSLVGPGFGLLGMSSAYLFLFTRVHSFMDAESGAMALTIGVGLGVVALLGYLSPIYAIPSSREAVLAISLCGFGLLVVAYTVATTKYESQLY